MSSKSLEDLEVWRRARSLRQKVSGIVKGLPKEEKYLLKDQMIRSSRSVSANIAEGHGRFHYQENIQFCRQARGSLVELFDHFTCALDEQYIVDAVFNEFYEDYQTVHKMINGYITYLVKRKATN